MQWNILNFGRLRCNVYLQDYLQQQYVVQYQKKVLVAAEEVDNALVSYVRQKQRRVHLANEVKASRRSIELSRKRYIGGDVDFQRVLDSQKSLLSSQEQLASTEASIVTSIIQLYQALGGGWQPVEPRSVDLVDISTSPKADDNITPEMIATPAPESVPQ